MSSISSPLRSRRYSERRLTAFRIMVTGRWPLLM